jgi:hypothetical protein
VHRQVDARREPRPVAPPDDLAHRAGHGVGEHDEAQRVERAVVEERRVVEAVPDDVERAVGLVLVPGRVADG